MQTISWEAQSLKPPFEAGDAITLLAGIDGTQLNFLKPVLGYADGVQAGSVPYIVVKDGENVINVLVYCSGRRTAG